MPTYTASHADVIDYLTRRFYYLQMDVSSPNPCDRQASAEILPMVETALQYFDTCGDGETPSAIIASVLGDVEVRAGKRMTWKGQSVTEKEQIYPGEAVTPYNVNSLQGQIQRTLKGWTKTEKNKFK